MTYTIESAVEALAATETLQDAEVLMQLIASETNWPIVDDSDEGKCLVPELRAWHADDGNAEVVEEHKSGSAAAQSYVDGGDWGEVESTIWITVRVWRRGIDVAGALVDIDEAHHKIAVDPDEPDCADGEEHDWQAPYEIVGGCQENPGVWGSGGSVACTEVCMRCGCAKTVDHWAQDPEDGERGLTSISYEPRRYADAVRAFRLAKLDGIAEDEGEFSTDRLVYDADECEYYVLHLNGGERGAHQRSGNFFPTFLSDPERLSESEAKQWLIDRANYSDEDADAALAEVA